MAPAPQTPTSDPQLGGLSNLHRMSRTAGLGNSEYTAVNVPAVIAVLVAAASALALVTPFFLLLALIGVVLAVVAIVQIRSSNGTQTGLPLAVVALLLSGGFSGVSGYQYVNGIVRERRDTAALTALTTEFGKLIAEKRYADALALTDARFREQVTPAAFENLFAELAKAPGLGPLTGTRSAGLFVIDADAETGLRMAVGNAMFDTQARHGDDALKTEIRYRNSGDTWRVFAIPQFFKQATADGQGGGPPSGRPAVPAGPPR